MIISQKEESAPRADSQLLLLEIELLHESTVAFRMLCLKIA